MLLKLEHGGTYVDATVGLGGHAEEILKCIGSDGRLICIDRDVDVLKIAMQRLSDKRVIFKKGRFSEINRVIAETGVSEVDGILFDLGTSMFQLKTAERGFSFMSEEPLDMRMDMTQALTAWDIVNRYPEKDIERILRECGEERFSRRIAKAIVNQRSKKKIDTCVELSNIVLRIYGGRGRHHPATRSFQALRIAVNDEMNELRSGLDVSAGILKSNGRLCIISYHSLEDRIAKNFIKENQRQGIFKIITKKPLTPSREEVRGNPSARSAKLRGAEKI